MSDWRLLQWALVRKSDWNRMHKYYIFLCFISIQGCKFLRCHFQCWMYFKINVIIVKLSSKLRLKNEATFKNFVGKQTNFPGGNKIKMFTTKYVWNLLLCFSIPLFKFHSSLRIFSVVKVALLPSQYAVEVISRENWVCSLLNSIETDFIIRYENWDKRALFAVSRKFRYLRLLQLNGGFYFGTARTTTTFPFKLFAFYVEFTEPKMLPALLLFGCE